MIYVQKYVDRLPTRSYITFQKPCALICRCNSLRSSASRRSTRFWRAAVRDLLPFSRESIKRGRTPMLGDKARLARRLNSSQNCRTGWRSIARSSPSRPDSESIFLSCSVHGGRCHVEKQGKGRVPHSWKHAIV